MALKAGDRLGPYEILAPIGAGGMGEVWKARDRRLDRVVAIKGSAAQFNERFEREAKAIAALNHPNICQIYDVGPGYIVMEYVEGTPITPVDTTRKLLDMAVQMSDGLAAAHAAGIVHRDLKPGNVLITRDGRVKILDFGLAKEAHEVIGADEATRTVREEGPPLTEAGTTVGTIAYMSPEQARGQTNLTAQSDQFSLGLVLYELAVGKRAFQRRSAAETMTAIIREDAEPLPGTVPAPLRWVVERLLRKEPTERYDSTRDLYRELRQLRDHLSETASASAISAVAEAPGRAGSAIKRRALLGASLAAALVLGAGLAMLVTHPAPADLSSYKFTRIARGEATEGSPVWSPDGKSIAYTAIIHGIYQVFTKTPDSWDTAQLTHAADDCIGPFWSSDGTTIYYNALSDLWAVPAAGGAPELVMKNVSAPALHPDGKTLVFNRDGKMWAGPLKGDTPRELPAAPQDKAEWMKFSPDGSRLAIDVRNQLWVLPWPSGTPRNLGRVSTGASWFPDSLRLIVSGGDFNNTLSVLNSTDGSRRVIYRVADLLNYPSLSPNGKKIVYSGGAAEWDVLEISMPEGRVHTAVGGGGVSWEPDWAPSGTHYLYSTFGNGGRGGIEDRFAAEAFSRRVAEAPPVNDPGNDTYALAPRWSSDSTRFLFVQGLVGRLQLTIANASGGHWTPIADNVLQMAHAWSPDGQWVAFLRIEGGRQRLFKVRPVAGATPVALVNAAPVAKPHPNYRMIQWSPAGDGILYQSAEGMSMISPDGNAVRKLTVRNLQAFAFSKDGARVYGLVRNTTGEGAQWQLYSIDVKTGADKMLASVDLPPSTNEISGFSLHPDGKRFLTSIAKWPYNIWMLEGWDQAAQKTWLDRLLRR
ncbi:MAG: protein kinase [Bryobacteraceae bacterium]|jgi:Tol biopolymer transport system component/predicted Ser/Thr protein kinase